MFHLLKRCFQHCWFLRDLSHTCINLIFSLKLSGKSSKNQTWGSEVQVIIGNQFFFFFQHLYNKVTGSAHKNLFLCKLKLLVRKKHYIANHMLRYQIQWWHINHMLDLDWVQQSEMIAWVWKSNSLTCSRLITFISEPIWKTIKEGKSPRVQLILHSDLFNQLCNENITMTSGKPLIMDFRSTVLDANKL